MSLFRCPLCQSKLCRGEKSYTCENNHCFDIAAQGYTHLLPVNKMHSKLPGDDAGMVAARADFLAKGYYEPLRNELIRCVIDSLPVDLPVSILDCGCGEGYYTGGIADALQSNDIAFSIAGIDISKFAVKRAAKRCKSGEFAVASCYHLPVHDESVDLILDVFAPLAIDEFRRVLKPGGVFLYVVPSARHLWQMKEVLYENPYENTVQKTPYEGFLYEPIRSVHYETTIQSQQDIHALFQMTPYYWKTPKAGAEALSALDSLSTEIQFDIHVFRKEV